MTLTRTLIKILTKAGSFEFFLATYNAKAYKYQFQNIWLKFPYNQRSFDAPLDAVQTSLVVSPTDDTFIDFSLLFMPLCPGSHSSSILWSFIRSSDFMQSLRHFDLTTFEFMHVFANLRDTEMYR